MEKETKIKLKQELKECEARIAEMYDEVDKVLEVGKLLKNILEANDVKEVLLASPVYSRFALENPLCNLDNDINGSGPYTVAEYSIDYKLDPDHFEWKVPEWIEWCKNRMFQSKYHSTLKVSYRSNHSIIVRLGIVKDELYFTWQSTRKATDNDLPDYQEGQPIILPESNWLKIHNLMDSEKWLKIAQLLLTKDEVWKFSNNNAQFHRLKKIELEEPKEKTSLPDVFDYTQLENDGSQDIVTAIRFTGEWDELEELFLKLKIRHNTFVKFKFLVYRCMTAAPELDWGGIKNTTLFHTFVIESEENEEQPRTDIFSESSEPSVELVIFFTDITIKKVINNLHNMFPNLQMDVVMANDKHILASNLKHVKCACALLGVGRKDYFSDCVEKESDVLEYLNLAIKEDRSLETKTINSVRDPLIVGERGSLFDKFYYGNFEQLNKK